MKIEIRIREELIEHAKRKVMDVPDPCNFEVPFTAEDAHLLDMLDQMKKNIENWDEGKFHRWLGYIHGVLVTRSMTTVKELRDETRPLYDKSNYYYGRI